MTRRSVPVALAALLTFSATFAQTERDVHDSFTRGNELTSLGKLLDSYSYKGVLDRGFALVVDDQGHIVRSRSAVRPGQLLAIEVADGQFGAAVSGAPVQRKKPRPPRDDGGQESLF